MCADVCGCVEVCAGVCRCAWVCFGMRKYARVGLGVCGSVQVYECDDEFSEYLLEIRILTSADFNTYPIRIFYYLFI